MGATTEISWTEATWNPVIGCSKVSAGCENCYAERMAMRFGATGEYYKPVMKDNGYGTLIGWSGQAVRMNPKFNPLTARKPRTIFVCSMGDLFHESVPFEWVDEIMKVIVAATWHRFMVLTKRPARMKEYMEKFPWGNPPRNLALGVSIEDQKTADKRIPLLLQTPAFRRFVSYEPALGPVKMRPEWLGICEQCGSSRQRCRSARIACCPDCQHGRITGLDLVIMGGESGPKARPMHPDWARSMRDQCLAAGVPFHFKQWGEWVAGEPSMCHRWCKEHGQVFERIGKKAAGRLLDGMEHNESIKWE